MARHHLVEVFDPQLIEVWRALKQQGFKDGAQDTGSSAFSRVAPLVQQVLHAVSNHLHVFAAKDLARQDDIHSVVLAEPVKV